MKQYVPFHIQLKRERELRGWTQADLASKLPSDPKTINRWESGKSVPRSYFRQKFAELFEKSVEELGFKENGKTADDVLEHGHQEDCSEVPSSETFYGRDKEVATLKSWIEDHHCRVIAVLGIGGIGKTSLAANVLEYTKDAFEYVFWRSLQNAPPIEEFLRQCIQFVSGQKTQYAASVDDHILQLIQHLQIHRCLIIIDNIESILQPGQRAGEYQEGYESYGRLLLRIGEISHQSCLLFTSREKPKEVAYLEGKMAPVRSLPLLGVEQAAGQEILKDKNLFGSQEQWATLVHMYSGNPLALRIVSEPIRELFGGDIAQFLQAEQTAFAGIDDLLEQQFCRLTLQEQEILYWLAIEREPVSLEDLRVMIVHPTLNGELLNALDSLRRRFLVETTLDLLFTLQPVVMEYITNDLVKRAYKNFISETAGVWAEYTLMKAQAKDFVRDSQRRLILAPVAQQLLFLKGKQGIEQILQGMIVVQRTQHAHQQDYLVGNVLHLLKYLHVDIRNYDFSHLTVRQAYLQGVSLPNVNFDQAQFISSVFTNTFGNVLSLTCSPDENVCAAGTATGEIWIYQISSGIPLHTYRGHTDGVWSIAFSSDGRILASASDDNTIRLWDMHTRQCFQILYDHTNRVRSVAFSPSENILASASDDKTVRLWDIQTATCLKILHGHTDRVWAVTFTPDGNVLATGSTDKTVRLWDVHSGHCFDTLLEHPDWIRSLSFTSDKNILASSCDDHIVRLWNIETGQCLAQLLGHTNRVWSVAFQPHTQLLISSSEDHTIRLWDAKMGYCLNTLQGHTQGVRAVTISSDGRTLVSGGDDQAIRLWEISTGYCLKTLRGYTNRIWSITLSANGATLVSSSEDQIIRLWNVSTSSCFKTVDTTAYGTRSVAWSPVGDKLATGGEDQMVHLWDIKSGRYLHTLSGHTNWVRSVAFSADGMLLASGSEDTTVRVWDICTGQCLNVFSGHSSWVRSIAFNTDGSVLASSSDDHTIRVWELGTGRCLYILRGHTNRVRSVAFDSNTSLLASGSEDRTVRLWDVASGQCLRVFSGHSSWVRAVTFSPKSFIIASSSDDQTIYLWDATTGESLKRLEGHTNRIRAITFSSDGHMLVSGSDDGTIKLWNVQTGECFQTLVNERPYEQMNITAASGLTEAQRTTLLALGAVENV